MFLPIHKTRTNYLETIVSYFYTDHKVTIALDTNILIWSMEINQEAFDELYTILSKLNDSKKLMIPNWVVFEFQNHLDQNKYFSEFKEVANSYYRCYTRDDILICKVDRRRKEVPGLEETRPCRYVDLDLPMQKYV